MPNKSTETVYERCYAEDHKIKNIQEYLECSKALFESNLGKEKLKKVPFEDFVAHESVIGMGAFGRVMLAHHKSDKNTFFAMKVMRKEQILRQSHLQHVLNELRFLSAISHPFIIHLEYYMVEVCHIYFVMPFIVGGDLFTLMKNKGILNEHFAQFYAGQLVLALEYLHTLDIIYRDLKPENILINKDGYIKLTDLGLSKRTTKKSTTLCGTPQYLAPEILMIKPYGKPVDWWALGVVMYEIVSGNLPFNDEQEKTLFKKIMKGIYKKQIHFSPNFTNLVDNLLENDSMKRIGNLKNGIDDIKTHRWFETMDWVALYNKQVDAPFKPSFASLSDTKNFEKYSVEDANIACNDVDEKYFEDF